MMKNSVFAESQNISLQDTCWLQRVEKSGRYHLNQVKKLTSTVMRQIVLMYLLMTQHHFCDILAKNAEPQPNHEKASDKPTLENIVQNKWPGLFKHVKVIRAKNRLRNFHRLEKAKETWQLNARWYPELDLGLKKKKDISGTICEV